MIGATVVLSDKAIKLKINSKYPRDRKGIIVKERYSGRCWSILWEGNKADVVMTKDLVEIVHISPGTPTAPIKELKKILGDPPRKRLSAFPVNKDVDDYIANLEREAKELMNCNKPVAQR